jgi:hypothetical protein
MEMLKDVAFVVFVAGLVMLSWWAWCEWWKAMNVPSVNGAPLVCVDFDGVIHSYRSGWVKASYVADPPVPGAIAWLTELVTCGRFRVCIHSSRSYQRGGIKAMKTWLLNFELEQDVLDKIEFPVVKPPAHLIIDDRCYRFEGDHFPGVGWISNFRPWWDMRDNKGHVRDGYQDYYQDYGNRFLHTGTTDVPTYREY